MIDLYKVGSNPYEDEEISLDEIIAFARAQVPLVTAHPVAPEVSFELTAVGNALDGLDASLSDETSKLGLQKARTLAKQNFRGALPNQISRIYGAALEAYGSQSETIVELFPEGRDVFAKCTDGQLEAKLTALRTAVTAHAADLGAAMQTLANTLVTNWETVYVAATGAKGQAGGSAFARRAAATALKTALGLLRLELGKQLFGQEAVLRGLFPQHLLGIPVEGSGSGGGGNGGGTGSVPAQATIGSVSQVSPGDWVLYSIAASGADSFRIEERVNGGAWTQIAQAVPAGDYVLGMRTPGEYEWRALGVNAAGAGPASEPVGATVTLPALTAIAIESAQSVPNGSGSNDLQVTYAAAGGEAATSAELRIQPPGEDPLIVVPLVRPSQTVAGTFQTGTQVTLVTAAIRGTEVVLSEALTITV